MDNLKIQDRLFILRKDLEVAEMKYHRLCALNTPQDLNERIQAKINIDLARIEVDQAKIAYYSKLNQYKST